MQKYLDQFAKDVPGASRSTPPTNKTGDSLLAPNDLYNRVLVEFQKLLPPGDTIIIDGNFQEVAKSVITNIYATHFKAIKEPQNYLKGECIAGPYGLGKTLLIEASRNVLAKSFKGKAFRLASCHSIYLAVKKDGIKALDDYISPGHCFFDDIGQESNVVDFGNYIELMTSIINERYNHFRRKPCITHFTTNMTARQIEETYGGHTFSRLKQMCNFHLITGKDKR